jgi:hypothetical protein
MDASDIIHNLMVKGVHLAPTDHGTIKVTPSTALTDTDRDLLRSHKGAVLAELQKREHVNIVNVLSGLYPPRTNGPHLHTSAPDPEPAEDCPGNHWLIHLSDGRKIEVCLSPPQTREWVLENWQALDAVRLPDIQMAGPDQ